MLLAVLFSPAAEALNWTKRYIAGGVPSSSVLRDMDVMVLPDGTPAVGYVDLAVGPVPTVSFVEGQTVRNVDSPVFSNLTSFKADPFGIISYAGFGFGESFGTDYGQRQVLDAVQRPELMPSLGGRNGELVLDSRGIPTIVSRPFGLPDDYLIGTFDTVAGQWTTRTVPSAIPILGPPISAVAAWTADDRLVIGSSNGFDTEFAIEQSNGTFFTLTIYDPLGNPNVPNLSASIATDASGKIGFAYRESGNLNVGVFDNGIVTHETVATGVGPFTPISAGSLAYAPDGTLGLAYIDGTQGDVMYATRTAPNTWTTEILPVEGVLASLAYDDAGNPFIGVAGDGRIELLSPFLIPPLPGDYDNSGQVGQGDLALVLAHWGAAVTDGQSPDPELWLNDQSITGSVIGQDELALVLANWGDLASANVQAIAAATGLSESQVEGLIPEPTSAALMLLGGLVLLRRHEPIRG